ncbi:MAG: TetR/AcrR family transcriptional regulator [Thermodesulfobacteriota bacterium]
MARNREFNMDEAVFSAMNLFWLNGFTNTSLDKLLESMKIGKGSFYQAFDNKHGLYLKTLQLYKDQSRDFYTDITSRGKGIKRINNYIECLIDEMYKEEFVKRGCFLCNASIENAGKDREITDIVHTGFKEVIGILNEMVKEAQIMGEVNSDIEPDQIAHWLFSMSYGLLILAKSDFKKSKIKEVAKNSLAIIS